MQCPACSTPHPDTARFCPDCGHALRPDCAACGAPLPAEARFCAQCGTPTAGVAAPPAPVPKLAARVDPTPSLAAPESQGLSGEKRLVTLLFADMSSSVEATRDLHPEDALELVNALLKAIADAVMEYGGRIDRFLGDGALAVFGTPRAHETDPERAIFAALRIRAAAQGLGVNVTAGINTGEVYVGAVGSDRYQENTVMGPVVSLAARLQGHAEPGEILVGESTFRQAAGAFRFAPKHVHVRGLHDTVTAYRVERPLHRPEKLRGIDGLRSELIAREAELLVLRQALRDTAAGGGRVVTLIGEAGVGKSRLVAELRAGLERDAFHVNGVPVLWLEGRCVELGAPAGYAPFLDLMRQWCGLTPEAEEGIRRERLLGALDSLAAEGALPVDACEHTAPYLLRLLSPGGEVGAEGGESALQLRSDTFAAFHHLFRALAQSRPLVLVLDDLHWADSLSLELLSTLLELVAGAPILLLCVYRPEREHRCSQIGPQAARRVPSCFTEILLGELSHEAGARLVGALVGADTLSPALRDVILRKCHGNPLFVEELVRSLIDSGILYREAGTWKAREGAESIAVPETLQSVILSRFDRLRPALREVLQAASVLGCVFRPRILERLCPQPEGVRSALQALEEHGLVFVERALPDAEYSFKHVLVQETVYETLLRRRRGALHQQAAEALEALYADNLEEYFDEVAQHYSQSSQAAKAVEYLLKAGDKARRLYANQEAARYFERALEIADRLPAGEQDARWKPAALEALGDVRFRMGAHPAAEACFRRSLETRASDTDARRIAALHWKLADAVHWQGHMPQAIELAEQGLAVLGPERCTPEGVNLLEVIMRSGWAANDMERAREVGTELEALLPGVAAFESLYMIHYALAWLEIRSSDFPRAEQWLEAMERVCLAQRNENGLARCYHGLGDMYRARKEFDAAAEWFRKSLEYCERTRDAHLLMEGHLERAHLFIMMGRPLEDAEPHLQRGMALAEEMSAAGGVSSIPALCAALGNVYAERGELARAIHFFRRTFDFGENPFRKLALTRLRALYADQGEPDEFERFRAAFAPADEAPAPATAP